MILHIEFPLCILHVVTLAYLTEAAVNPALIPGTLYWESSKSSCFWNLIFSLLLLLEYLGLRVVALNDIRRLAPTQVRVHSIDLDARLHRLQLVLVHSLVSGPGWDSSAWVEMALVRIQILIRDRQEVFILLN